MTRKLKFTFRANIDTIEAYEYYEFRQVNLGERFLLELDNCCNSIVLNYSTYKNVHTIYRQAKIKKFPYVILYSVDDWAIIMTAIFNTSRNPDKKFK